MCASLWHCDLHVANATVIVDVVVVVVDDVFECHYTNCAENDDADNTQQIMQITDKIAHNKTKKTLRQETRMH